MEVTTKKFKVADTLSWSIISFGTTEPRWCLRNGFGSKNLISINALLYCNRHSCEVFQLRYKLSFGFSLWKLNTSVLHSFYFLRASNHWWKLQVWPDLCKSQVWKICKNPVCQSCFFLLLILLHLHSHFFEPHHLFKFPKMFCLIFISFSPCICFFASLNRLISPSKKTATSNLGMCFFQISVNWSTTSG